VKMRKFEIGLLALVALVVLVESEKSCLIDGVETLIPDEYECEKYIEMKAAGYRFPQFPWEIIPPIISTLFPNLTRRPTTTPIPDSGETDEGCPEEGIEEIPHPDSCKKFILCVNGFEVPRSCPDGLHFSPKLRECMEPEEAGCEDNDDDDDREECPETGIKSISHPDNCEKYILCVNGMEIKQECPAGLHFSRTLRECTTPKKAECEVDEDREECPAEGIKNISHPDNCEKYIICFNGMEIERNCPAGLHFSRELRECTDPEKAECEVDDDDDDREECPAEGIKNISHPKNCEKFIICVNGMEIERSCPAGLHFSRELRQCTDPEKAECEVDDDDDDQEECPAEGIKNISHPKECGMFIICVNGMEIERNCPAGLHFSRELRECTDPEKAECEVDDDDDDDREECPAEGIKNISHPKECGMFIICVNGMEIERNCPAGLHFSRELRECTDPEKAECEVDDDDDDREECPAEGIKNISHPKNCEKYIICVNGMEIERNCPAGLHFSRELRECTDPEKAECEDDDDDREECPAEGIKNISHPKNCEKYIICVNGMEIERSCPAGLHFSRELRECTDPEKAECEVDDDDDDDDREECPAEGIKNISHPKNCEKFIICVNGIEIERNCPSGLHFSRALRECTTPEDAKCEVDSVLKCPKVDDPNNVIFLPNTKDCSMFYVCFSGEPHPITCADGLHWSVKAEDCLPPHEAGCEDDDIEQCPDTGIKSIAHPANCGMFVLCVNGNRLERDCPAGLHFSRVTRTCIDPEDAGCEKEDDDRERCPATGVESISHPYNCEKYILCVDGIEINRNCPVGRHFSRELRECVDPAIAECEERTYECPEEDNGELVFLPNTEDCSRFYACFDGEPYPLSCGDDLHWSVEHNSCMKEKLANCRYSILEPATVHCPDSGIVNIADPTSCDKYILCIGGTKISRGCTSGLHFSRDSMNCVLPELAQCNVEV
jgi:hypothetical protein